jgi:3-oxoacyl-[acyl-carrier protein] reductase
MSTEKKTVLVTGAGIGIGKATAFAFADAGYKVVVTDVLRDEGIAVAEEIKAKGGEACFHLLDVSSTEQTDAVVEAVERQYGSLDVIVANAGIARKEPLSALSDASWDRILDVDLKSVMRIVRAAAPGMKSRGGGSVVALTSIMGVAYGWREHAHYSAAKAGVIGLVRALAVELASDGIRVNGVAPGIIRTAQALSKEHSLGPDGLEKAAGYIPLGRVGEADDVADVILFLASHAARYVTGEVIIVDGGLIPSGPK